jgi:putative transposase
MARLARFMVPGQPQHLIQRGNNRDVTFAAADDYLFFLDRLRQSSERHRCDIHAYVLMTNHVHLLMTPHKKDGIGKLMQSLRRYYASE